MSISSPSGPPHHIRSFEGRQRIRALASFAVVLAALAATACFGGDGDDDAEAPDVVTPVTTTMTQTAAAGASPSPTAAITPSPTAATTPTETATPTAGSGSAAVSAAVELLDAVYLDALDRDACAAADPPSRICITLESGQETVDNGLARFMAGDLDVGGFIFFMGRLPDGAWSYWFGTQQQVDIPESLPAALLACGSEAPISVYDSPAGAPVGEIGHMAEVTAQEFGLSAGGSFGADGLRGEGWYRISAPSEGWVYADDVTDAAMGDCLLHEELVGSSG